MKVFALKYIYLNMYLPCVWVQFNFKGGVHTFTILRYVNALTKLERPKKRRSKPLFAL